MSVINFIKDQVDIGEYISHCEPVAGCKAGHVAGDHARNDMERLAFWPDSRTWKCFSCGAGGSVIDYEMDRAGHDDPVRAAEDIARAMRISIPDNVYRDKSPEAQKARKDADILRAIRETACNFFQDNLSSAGKDYFLGRGFTPETIKEHRFGETRKGPFALLNHVKHEMGEVDRELLKESGLFHIREGKSDPQDFFFDRYMIPFLRGTEPIAFVGRARDAKTETKYLCQPGQSGDGQSLWNASEVQINLRQQAPEIRKPILICEGILDGALARQELREEFAVCATATSSLSGSQRDFLAGLLLANPARVVFAFDRERNGAGEKGAFKAAWKLREAILKAAEDEEEARLESADADADADAKKPAEKKKKGADADAEKPAPKKKKKSMPEIELPDLRIALLPRAPETEKVDLADFLLARGADKARVRLAAAVSLDRYEKKLVKDPSRFFISGRGGARGEFQPAWLADELQADGFYLFSGEQLYRYRGGAFREDEAGIRKEIRKRLGGAFKPNRAEDVMKTIAVDTAVQPERLNLPGIVNFKNGMLDLKTGELQPHSPYRLSSVQFKAIYDSKAEAPCVERFLKEILLEEDVLRIFEMVGYAMDASANFHSAFLLVGGGNNGKSTLLKVIEKLFGSENLCTVGLQTLEDVQWAPARLFGKSANVVADMELSVLKTAAIFKAAVAGDRISGERKFKPNFEFEPTTTHILSMNELPPNFDRTDGFYRRLEIIDFPFQFVDEPSKPTEKKARSQKELIDELTTERELNGFASLAIYFYRLALARDALTSTDASRAAVEDYREQNQPELRFFKETLETGAEEDFLSIGEIYAEYQAWLEEEFAGGRKPIPKRRLNENLKGFFEGAVPGQKKRAGRVHKGCFVLRWRAGYPMDVDG